MTNLTSRTNLTPRTTLAPRATVAPRNTLASPITIRIAAPDDQLALIRLAALDSADAPPSGRVLLAEVDGELCAALSLDDGSTIADPFYPTLHILELLRTHAKQMERRGGRRRRLRLRYAVA